MIKTLTEADVKPMAMLHADSFYKGWLEADMLQHVNTDIALGWFEGAVLRGFILIQLAAGQCEILTIAVDHNARKSGIGLALIKAGERAANSAEILFLEVAEDNKAAIALYKRAGFESFGRRPGYYKREGGRVAARLFRKNLSPRA